MEIRDEVQVQPRAFDVDIKVPRIGEVVEHPSGDLSDFEVAVKLDFPPPGLGRLRVFDVLFVNKIDLHD